MTSDLKDILDGKETAPVEEVQEQETEQTEEVEEQGEAPETPESETEVPPTPEPKEAPKKDEEHVPLAALKAERKKRQELEARLAQQEQPRLDIHSQPEQYVNQAIANRVFAMSEAQAREMYADYDDVVNEFVEYAADKPTIQAELAQSAHPAVFAYKQGKALLERKEMQDLPTYKAKLRAEVEAEVRAQLAAEQAAKKKAADSIPPDLSGARSSRAPEPVLNESLDSILKSKG